MGRPHRAAEGGYVYHVLNRANARMTIFRDEADYEAFEKVLLQAVERTKTAPAGVLPDAQSLAPGRLAAEGWRTVAVCRLADPDAHAALARPSPFDRLGACVSGPIQIVSNSRRRTSSIPWRGMSNATPCGRTSAGEPSNGVGAVCIAGCAVPLKTASCWPLGLCRASRAGSTT